MIAYLKSARGSSDLALPAFDALGNDSAATTELWNARGERLTLRGLRGVSRRLGTAEPVAG